MEVLIYPNRKYPLIYDISTPEKECAAVLLVFKKLDEWGVYAGLEEDFLVGICEQCVAGFHQNCDLQTGNIYCGCDKSDDCKRRARGLAQDSAIMARRIKLYNQARAGDASAAESLLVDYEQVQFLAVADPLNT